MPIAEGEATQVAVAMLKEGHPGESAIEVLVGRGMERGAAGALVGQLLVMKRAADEQAARDRLQHDIRAAVDEGAQAEAKRKATLMLVFGIVCLLGGLGGCGLGGIAFSAGGNDPAIQHTGATMLSSGLGSFVIGAVLIFRALRASKGR